MNYYLFHIGDYVSATRHLSWEEDAAYRRLLDVYYRDEKPIPSDPRAACRLVLATTPEQREAVETVLREFFEPTDSGWTNRRADAEIDAMRGRQQKARDKANKRWHQPRTAMPQHGGSDAAACASDAAALLPVPAPVPAPAKREDRASPGLAPAAPSPPPPARSPTRKRAAAPKAARVCPDGFTLTPAMRAWARLEVPHVDIEVETAKFRDHEFPRPRSDWPATWRNWLRRAVSFSASKGNGHAAASAPDAGPTAWFETLGGVKAKGAELGIPYGSDDACRPFPEYRARVLRELKRQAAEDSAGANR